MSSHTPSVSVIVPFYNSCRFLSEAVESVLSQTFTDWELLLVDDGSTDSSSEIARVYMSKHPGRVYYSFHSDRQNHGLTSTRNLALRSCRGEFVALLDSDDVWYPVKLTQQVELLKRHSEAGMVFGRSQYWNDGSDASTAGRANSVPKLAVGDRMYYPPDLIKISYPLGKLGSPCPSDLLFRRSTLLQVGGFDERVPGVCEDLAFLAKMFLNAPVYVSDDCWDRYRLHPDSMWAKAQANGEEENSKASYFKWLGEYLYDTGVEDKEVWRLYKLNSWKYRHKFLAGCVSRVRHLAHPLKSIASR